MDGVKDVDLQQALVHLKELKEDIIHALEFEAANKMSEQLQSWKGTTLWWRP